MVLVVGFGCRIYCLVCGEAIMRREWYLVLEIRKTIMPPNLHSSIKKTSLTTIIWLTQSKFFSFFSLLLFFFDVFIVWLSSWDSAFYFINTPKSSNHVESLIFSVPSSFSWTASAVSNICRRSVLSFTTFMTIRILYCRCGLLFLDTSSNWLLNT